MARVKTYKKLYVVGQYPPMGNTGTKWGDNVFKPKDKTAPLWKNWVSKQYWEISYLIKFGLANNSILQMHNIMLRKM